MRRTEPDRPTETSFGVDGRWNHNTAFLQPLLVVVSLARSSTTTDFADDLAGTIANRVVRARRGFWQPSAPVAEPDVTYAEMRRVAADQLAGGVFRRRLYYRYTLTWTRPR